MWKEILPDNCPIEGSKEMEENVFRILKDKDPCDEDFWVHAKKFPNNPRYKTLCAAYAVSFYNTKEKATHAINESIGRGNKIGDYIAEYTLTKDDGISKLNENSGHLNTWFYSTSQFNIFAPINVIEFTNEN